MKRNIYSKLWMIFFVLMGAACTNQVEDAIPVSGQPIGFSVQSDWKEIPNTRSNDKTQFDKGDKVQIFGFHKSSQEMISHLFPIDFSLLYLSISCPFLLSPENKSKKWKRYCLYIRD